MQDWTQRFYSHAAWLRCRDAFIAKRRAIDGGLCQRCHKRVGYIVHHKIQLTPENISQPEVALNHRNLEYLCHECHNIEHGVFVPATPAVAFDENGDVVAAIERRDSPR